MPSTESVSLDLYVKVGSRDETPDNNGISHLLEHLHFRSLVNMTQEDIYYETESMGASLKAGTSKEFLRFYIKFRPNYISRILDLLVKIVEMDKWTEKDIEQEKTVVINEIVERESCFNEDRYIEWDLWKKHPLCLSIVGTEDSVSDITLKDIIEHKKNAFRNDNMFFVISGKLATTDIELIINKISSIRLTEGGKLPRRMVPSKSNKPIVSFVKTNNDFLDVIISFKNDYSLVDRESLVLLSSIIGGGYGAILQRLVREKVGLLYNIFSEVYSYGDTAILQIQCGVKKKNLMEVLNVVFNAIKKTKMHISQKEMLINIPFYTDNLLFWKEDTSIFNENIGWEIALGSVNDNPIQQKIDKYLSITKEQIMNAAKALFTIDNTYVLILGATGRYTKKEVIENICILEEHNRDGSFCVG